MNWVLMSVEYYSILIKKSQRTHEYLWKTHRQHYPMRYNIRLYRTWRKPYNFRNSPIMSPMDVKAVKLVLVTLHCSYMVTWDSKCLTQAHSFTFMHAPVSLNCMHADQHLYVHLILHHTMMWSQLRRISHIGIISERYILMPSYSYRQESELWRSCIEL